MARQSVGNPKFYIDYLSYWSAKGNIESVDIMNTSGDFRKLVGLNPSDFINEDIEYPYTITINLKDGIYMPSGTDDKFFIGLFGHNFLELMVDGVMMKLIDHTGATILNTSTFALDEICNWDYTYNGWSMAEWTGGQGDSFYSIEFTFSSGSADSVRTILGSLGFGYAFQMPHSPDLKLTMTRDYSGIKEQNTRGGSTLTQINYHNAADWAGYPAWELYTGNTTTYISNNFVETRDSARGRRIWKLNFSYIGNKNMMPINELVNFSNPTDSETEGGYDSSDFNASGNFSSDIRRDSSFMGVVMEKTIGGALPFVFQPDGDNNSPDQFAICKIDKKSFNFKQVAHNVYDVSLKIREVW